MHYASHITTILTCDAVGDLRQVEVGFVPQMSAGGNGGQVQTSRKVDVCIIQSRSKKSKDRPARVVAKKTLTGNKVQGKVFGQSEGAHFSHAGFKQQVQTPDVR